MTKVKIDSKARNMEDKPSFELRPSRVSESASDTDPSGEPEARLAEIVAELAKTHAEYEDKLQV